MDWTGLARYSRVFIMVQASVQLSFYASTNQCNYGNAATSAHRAQFSFLEPHVSLWGSPLLWGETVAKMVSLRAQAQETASAHGKQNSGGSLGIQAPVYFF